MVGSRDRKTVALAATVIAVAAAIATAAGAATPLVLRGSTEQRLSVSVRLDGTGRPTRIAFEWDAGCRGGGVYRDASVFPHLRHSTARSFTAIGGYTARQRGGWRFRVRTAVHGTPSAGGRRWKGWLRGSADVRRHGRFVTRCVLRPVHWNATAPAGDQTPQPLPGTSPAPTPSAPSPSPSTASSSAPPTYSPTAKSYGFDPRQWRLQIDTDPAEPVGGVLPYSGDFGPPDTLGINVDDQTLSFSMRDRESGDLWQGRLAPRRGDALATGSYTGTKGTWNADAPQLNIEGRGRACDDPEGRFDVQELRRDATGRITALHVTFEQHCDGAPTALRGTLEFTAP